MGVALRGGDEAVVVEVGVVVAVVVSAWVVTVSVIVVVALAVLVVVDVVVAVVVVGALVVGSVVVGGSSARAAVAAPLPKRTIVASVPINLWRAMGCDYRRLSSTPLYSDRDGGLTAAPTHTPARPTDHRAPSAVRRRSNLGLKRRSHLAPILAGAPTPYACATGYRARCAETSWARWRCSPEPRPSVPAGAPELLASLDAYGPTLPKKMLLSGLPGPA